MDEVMAGDDELGVHAVEEDPFEELDRYFDPRKRLPTREECLDPIPWWGVSHSNFYQVLETATLIFFRCMAHHSLSFA
jgi:hypothetical protein